MMGFARRQRFWAIVAGAAMVGGGLQVAQGYSTKLHLVTGYHLVELLTKNNCQIPLSDWNQGNLAATPEYFAQQGKDMGQAPGETSRVVVLNREICDLIIGKDTQAYFLSATTGPDTFPGMFGNTDPTHALLWNTNWQIQLLWQNAQTPAEKAFALGWLVHFAGDLFAHGLANLHAQGVWMSGGRLDTVWKHIVTESYYAKMVTSFPKMPGGAKLDNTLKWPEEFVKRMFFNPNSPLYRHADYLWNKRPDILGAVAIAFESVYRTLFLVWDWHAGQAYVWRGRREYYLPRKDRSISDFFHWLFADQAYNLHLRKHQAVKKVIDAWYEATHRAQQAIVADADGVFDGTKKYPQTYTSFGKEYTKKDVWASGGTSGAIDAYKFLVNSAAEYFSPQVITITDENFPTLRKILDALNKVGAKVLIDGVRAVLNRLKNILLWPLRKLAQLIKSKFEPQLQKIGDWFSDQTSCARMPAMCKSIEAQRVAFGVVPGQIETYLNWSLYRNSIVNSALLLEQLQSSSKESGDETTGPVFGMPSGDFGCTGMCTATARKYWRLYMPLAGKYYQNPVIQQAMPDYCTGTDRRRNLPVNESFAGKNDNETNWVGPDGVPFTCFLKRTEPCDPAKHLPDPQAGRAPPKLTGVEGEMMHYLFGSARWSFHSHLVPRASAMVTSDVQGAGGQKSLCYQVLAVNAETMVPALPNPMEENKSHYKVEPYNLRAMIGDLYTLVSELYSQVWPNLERWLQATFLAGIEAAKRAAEKAKVWVERTSRQMGPLFSKVLDTMWQTVSHLFHSKSRCLGETADQARRAAQEALVRARQTIRDFWDHLAPDLRNLPAGERASVVSGPWASLTSTLWAQLNAVREGGASRIRLWFTKGQSKDEGQRHFRNTFQGAVGGLEGEMSTAYYRGIQ